MQVVLDAQDDGMFFINREMKGRKKLRRASLRFSQGVKPGDEEDNVRIERLTPEQLEELRDKIDAFLSELEKR